MNQKKDKLWILYLISGVIFVGFTIASLQNRVYEIDLPINLGLFGTYGDFIGGVLGTAFALASVLILKETLEQQRQENIDNRSVLTNDNFNSLFFELVKLYHQHISALKDDNGGKLTGKDLLEQEMENMQSKYQNTTSYQRNLAESQALFEKEFYAKYKSKISICFSTLYRIYDLIDTGEITENQKRNYSKTIRAQLTQVELFFLRYNAMSCYGENFVKYINKYRILKHLPTFELLEFKSWWHAYEKDSFYKSELDMIFYQIKRSLRRLHKGGLPQLESVEKGAIQIDYKPTKVELSIKKAKIGEIDCLKNFEAKQIQQLLDCFLKEFYVYSSFEEIYDERALHFGSDKIIDNVNSWVETKDKTPLLVKMKW